MRLQFSSQDSIYSIFKRLKKVPPYKSVSIFIDPDHAIFAHQRWGQQLAELVQEYHLDATFIVMTPGAQAFYKKHNLTTSFKHKHLFSKIIQYIKEIRFKTQEFHTNIVFKNSYISYLVIFSELCVIGLILYFFWGLISPNATITITPAHHIERIVYNYAYIPYDTANTSLDTDVLHIPVYKGSIPYKHRMTLNVQNISYTIENAQGTVQFFNKQSEGYSLVPNTQLTTADGLVFTIDEAIYVPAGTETQPGTSSVKATALEYTEGGEVIGEEGNIAKDTLLYIKNLPESTQDKRIYATAKYGFVGGKTETKGSVIAKDIADIEATITTYMEDNKKEELQRNTSIPDDAYLLLYDDHIVLEIEEFVSTSHIGDSTSFVEGEVQGTIHYTYILQEDIKQAVTRYIQQRASDNIQLLNYDFSSFTMYDIHKTNDQGRLYIPTQINIVRGYNFHTDVNKLIPEMKAKIAKKTSNDARNILLEYEQIQDAQIAISPPWYDTLPDVHARIKFRVSR